MPWRVQSSQHHLLIILPLLIIITAPPPFLWSSPFFVRSFVFERARAETAGGAAFVGDLCRGEGEGVEDFGGGFGAGLFEGFGVGFAGVFGGGSSSAGGGEEGAAVGLAAWHFLLFSGRFFLGCFFTPFYFCGSVLVGVVRVVDCKSGGGGGGRRVLAGVDWDGINYFSARKLMGGFLGGQRAFAVVLVGRRGGKLAVALAVQGFEVRCLPRLGTDQQH